MSRFWLHIITFGLLCLLLSSPANSETFRVGVENASYYPYSEVYQGEYVGVGRDIIELFGSTKGYLFDFIHNPLARNKKLFIGGELDFLFPDSPQWTLPLKESVNKPVHYSQGFVDYIDGVSVLTQNSHMSLDQLNTLGVLIGFSPVDYYTKNSRIRISTNTSINGLVQQLILGRVDGIYLSRHVVQHQLKLLEKTSLVSFMEEFPKQEGTYHLSTIQYPKIIQEFDRFLSTHKREILLIRRQYGLSTD